MADAPFLNGADAAGEGGDADEASGAESESATPGASPGGKAPKLSRKQEAAAKRAATGKKAKRA